VLSGLFEIVKRLYGVSVSAVDDLPVWHPQVRTYRMLDTDGAVLGYFYADFFPREQKRDGAWMNAFLTGERLAAQGGRTPHVGLICGNMTPPVGDTPSLLGHREVETVFHEFGHLLHHMLTDVPVRSLAGTNVAWDFVELPSQIMENFCWEKEALDLFARHYQTGSTIPNDLFEKLQRARTYRGANDMMRQLGFASVDLELHMSFDGAKPVIAFARELMARFAPAPLPADYAMVLGFGHLFSHPVGYAGGYYSYKWAEVLDADAFSRFATEGVFSEAVGSAFRAQILSRGDSSDPMELFKAFMGREPDLRALLARSGIAA
jgi:oligopeptidase A